MLAYRKVLPKLGAAYLLILIFCMPSLSYSHSIIHIPICQRYTHTCVCILHIEEFYVLTAPDKCPLNVIIFSAIPSASTIVISFFPFVANHSPVSEEIAKGKIIKQFFFFFSW